MNCVYRMSEEFYQKPQWSWDVTNTHYAKYFKTELKASTADNEDDSRRQTIRASTINGYWGYT